MKMIARITIAAAFLTICTAEEAGFTSSDALTAERNFEKALKNAENRYLRELGAALRVAMSKGDLAEANRIQSQLKRIDPSGNGAVNIPSNDEELRDYLKDTRWKFPDGKMLTLGGNGKVKKSFGRMSPKWNAKNMVLTFDEGGAFEFAEGYTRMTSKANQPPYEGIAVLLVESER